MSEEINKCCETCKSSELGGDMMPCKLCFRSFFDYDGCEDMKDCWNPKSPHEASDDIEPVIKDSGERREFESGAVRDITEGKGRCDLLPLDVLGAVMQDTVFTELENFVYTRQTIYLYKVLDIVSGKFWNSKADMFLELAKHFEEGAKKYGEYNWQKGIPVHCYIDSAVRHYLKCLRGDKDEPHDRAFVWNIVCCIWTMMHKPECDDLPNKGVTEHD